MVAVCKPDRRHRRAIGLGTLDVGGYLKEVSARHSAAVGLKVELDHRWPTIGPEHRFNAVLFVESIPHGVPRKIK